MLHSIAALAHPLVWITLGAFFLTVGDVVFRGWLANHWFGGFAATYFIYIFGLLFIMMSFFSQHIAVATISVYVLNCVAYIAIAWWFFGDTLTTAQMAGIVLGLVSMALLQA
jgi:hypothetical protein